MTRGEKIVAFIEAYCKIPEGAQVGQPMKLMKFQKQFILDVYDNPHGTSRAYLSVARKNGKSALIAAVVLAHVVGPEAKQNSLRVTVANGGGSAVVHTKGTPYLRPRTLDVRPYSIGMVNSFGGSFVWTPSLFTY
jgi:hypothetical protein